MFESDALLFLILSFTILIKLKFLLIIFHLLLYLKSSEDS